jgi:hypothetical protein
VRAINARRLPGDYCSRIDWIRILDFERTEVFRRLRTHVPGYEKGAENVYAVTESSLDQAKQRAKRLQERFSAYTGTDPYTLVNEVVELLRAIRRPPP